MEVASILKRKKEKHLLFSGWHVGQMGYQLSLSITYEAFLLPKQHGSKALHSEQLRKEMMAYISGIDLSNSCISWLNLLMCKSLL